MGASYVRHPVHSSQITLAEKIPNHANDTVDMIICKIDSAHLSQLRAFPITVVEKLVSRDRAVMLPVQRWRASMRLFSLRGVR